MNSRRKLAAVAALGLALVLTPRPAPAQDYRLAIVITQRLLISTEIGKNAAGQLREKKDVAQQKLDRKANEIQDLKKDLEKRLMVLSAEEKDKAREEFERQQRDGLRMKEDLERDLQKEEQKVLGEVNEFLSKVVIDYGKANAYDIIIDASATLYFSDAPDITDDIIAAADQAYKSQ